MDLITTITWSYDMDFKWFNEDAIYLWQTFDCNCYIVVVGEMVWRSYVYSSGAWDFKNTQRGIRGSP